MGDPVSKEPECSSHLQLSKKRRRCSARIGLVGFSQWSQDRSAGPRKDLEHASVQPGQFTLSSFPVLFSRILSHLQLPLLCMCMTTSITHVMPSPCPFASHTGLTRSLSLPVLLLVTICVCLEIALRTCCSRLGKSELMTDRISSQTRNSHAHHARKSRPASPEHQTPES